MRIVLASPIWPARVRASVIVLAVEGHELALLGPAPVHRVGHPDDDHLVVGEQVALDCLAEAEPVQDRAEGLASSSIEATSTSSSPASRRRRGV